MDRILVVVFDTERQAYAGKETLLHMDGEGTAIIYSYAVVAKDSDATLSVRESSDMGPVGTLFGASLGAFIGALGGPAGLAIGAAVGLTAGGAEDLHNLRVAGDFIDDVIKELRPNKYALIAELGEEWTERMDERMEAIGGKVFRRAVSDVKHVIHDQHVAAMKADIAQFKAEHAKAHAGRKAKLQEKINELDSKIQAHLEKAKERRKAAQQRAKAKVAVLEARAARLKTQASDTRI